MALVFPPNPSIDDIYLGWRWDGAKWTYVSGVAGVAGVASYNTRTGAVTSVLADVTTVTGTGVTAQARLGLSTVAATGAYADLSGVPAIPAGSSTTPVMDGTAAVGVGTTWARDDHIHPTDTSRYAASNPSGYQTAAQVTDVLPVASSTTPVMDGTATIGVGTTWARADHIHPTDTSRYAASNPAGYQTAAQVTTALAPYAPLAAPVFTGDARAVTPTYGDNDTSIATSAFVQSAVSPALQNVGRNFLHNSMFNVQQRGLGGFTSAGQFTADRWFVGKDGADSNPTTTLAAISAANISAIGDESARYALQVVVAGSATAGSDTYASQTIESVRRTAGKTVTVSFWAWASASRKIGVGPLQMFGTGGAPSAAVTIAGQSVSVTTTPARYTLTFAIPSIAGKTVGTDGNDGLWLGLWLSASTDQNTASGSVGVQSGTFSLWGIQLEIGSVATPLAKRDPADELALCQRFYQIGHVFLQANNQSVSGQIGTYSALPVTMRAIPTLTVGTNNNININSFVFGTTGALGVYGSGTASNATCTMNCDFLASADL